MDDPYTPMTKIEKKRRKQERREQRKDAWSQGFGLASGAVYGYMRVYYLMALWLLFFVAIGVSFYFVALKAGLKIVAICLLTFFIFVGVIPWLGALVRSIISGFGHYLGFMLGDMVMSSIG